MTASNTKLARSKPMTKADLARVIADHADITINQALLALHSLEVTAKGQLGTGGPGVFAIPDLVKMTSTLKPATPAREVPHPFKADSQHAGTMTIKAKPARISVKAKVVKAFEDTLNKESSR